MLNIAKIFSIFKYLYIFVYKCSYLTNFIYNTKTRRYNFFSLSEDTESSKAAYKDTMISIRKALWRLFKSLVVFVSKKLCSFVSLCLIINSVPPCLCVLNKNYSLGPFMLSEGVGLAERVFAQ